MKVLVDTSVWSLALRRKKLNSDEIKIVNELKELIYELRVVMIGPIRQELLSGISDKKVYDKLKKKLRAFEDLLIQTEDYEKASENFNICRKHGIQGSHIDFLICAVSQNNKLSIFTTDKDFENYKKYININLYKIRSEL